MIDDVLAGFLDSLEEREFDAPLVALLRALGYDKIHLLHGSQEFGKDVIAQLEEEGGTRVQCTFQIKAGNLTQSGWRAVRGQLDELRTDQIAHPAFDSDLPVRPILVLTGRLVGNAPAAAQQYNAHLSRLGEPNVEVWDREQLVSFFLNLSSLGLTGGDRGQLEAIVNEIDDGTMTDAALERFSRRWTAGVGWRAALEAAIIASRLRRRHRLDLACMTALCLDRAVWAAAHGTEPTSEEAERIAEVSRMMFEWYAGELFDLLTADEGISDPKKVAFHEAGVFSTYPVKCLRIVELVSLLALLKRDAERDTMASWLTRFVQSQPGSAHPISDRWAVSLVPTILLVAATDRSVASRYVTELIRWVADHHDDGGVGLAPPFADARTEVDYLLGGALEHVNAAKRRQSYLATVILDTALACDLEDCYELALNEFAAVDARPYAPAPNDDEAQYRVEDVDVPTDVSPHYTASGTSWRRTREHERPVSFLYLGRLGRYWDLLAVSAVLRDRHEPAIIRELYVRLRGSDASAPA